MPEARPAAAAPSPPLAMPLAEAERRFRLRVLLIAPDVHLIDVALAIHEILIELELALLRLRLGLRDADLGLASVDLGLHDLILHLVDARLIFVVQADVQLGDGRDFDADVRQIRAIVDDRAGHVRAAAADVHERHFARL